ncbi:ABC transporter permease [Rhodococcus sp. BP-241]|uniref:ABC transporter permease n=1 Tax=Rhodococcus sp. BP-241 TaxID=2739441 RepID=UPI001C9A4D4C|nr:ABC transporter permease subunit [Rhodococcus sp. BP-241]MBY6706199.1 ABC transporter permease [Rhodococcus sp. BP-241]
MAFVKEFRQQVRDRRLLVMMFVPALIAPFMCLVLFLGQSGSSQADERVLTVTSAEPQSDLMAELAGIAGSLDSDSALDREDVTWLVRSSDSPMNDLLRGRSDLALIEGLDGSARIVASPISLDSAELTAQVVKRLQNSGTIHPAVDASSDSTMRRQFPQLTVASFLDEASAKRALAGYLLPILLLSLFTLTGSPIAIDAVAAEKENGTFESLKVLGAPGWGIMMGKMLSVVCAAVVMGAASLLLLLGIGHVEPRGLWNLGMDNIVGAEIGAEQVIAIAAFTMSALILNSAILLLVSGIANSVKEAQYWVSLVAFLPIAMGGASVLTADEHGAGRLLGVLPFSNSALGISNVASGHIELGALIQTVLINAVTTLIIVAIMVRTFFMGHLRIFALTAQ